MCLACRDRRPMAEALARVAAGEDDPPCLVCGGVLKSATVSWHQFWTVIDMRNAPGVPQALGLLRKWGVQYFVARKPNRIAIKLTKYSESAMSKWIAAREPCVAPAR